MTRPQRESDDKSAEVTNGADRARPAETAKASKPEYPAEKARQGQIILRTPLRKAIFFGGLIAFVLLAVIFSILSLR